MGEPNTSGLLAAGTNFGHYQIVRHLGSGGMGSVYEALHTKLSKRVAIKTLLPHYASNPEAQTRFLREGTLAAKLRHPHVVDVTDFGIEEGVPYLVMEFLEGYDLSVLLSRQQRLFPEQIADLMVPVIAALASAHDEQVVHRDLKPQNIFLTTSKTGELIPKVLDFGISKLLSDDAAQLTGTASLLGTPSYMSPEQARSSKNIDARSDQYTLAVILYQCVTGTLPFVGDGIYDLIRQVVEGQFQPPGEKVEGLPPEFEQVILRGMANRADDRYPSTLELGAALLPFASLRTQAVWQAEFDGAASTFIAKPGQLVASTPDLRVNTPGLAQKKPRADRSLAPSAKVPAGNPSLGGNKRGASVGGRGSSPAPEEAADGALAAQETRLGVSVGPAPASPARSRRDPSRPALPAVEPASQSADEEEQDERPETSSEESSAGQSSSESSSGDLEQAGLSSGSKVPWAALGIGVLVLGVAVAAWQVLGSDSSSSAAHATSLPHASDSPAATPHAADPAPAPTPPAAPVAAVPSPPPAAPPVVAAPTPAPAPVAPASAPAAVEASPEPAHKEPKHPKGPRHTEPASPAAGAANCNPPFTVDSQGHRVPKPECL